MGGKVRFRSEQQRSGTIEEDNETGDWSGLIYNFEMNNDQEQLKKTTRPMIEQVLSTFSKWTGSFFLNIFYLIDDLWTTTYIKI